VTNDTTMKRGTFAGHQWEVLYGQLLRLLGPGLAGIGEPVTTEQIDTKIQRMR
jgi:hypothetical protein